MIYFILFLLILIILFEIFVYFQYKYNKRLKSKEEFYPKVDSSLLEKFNSFDNKLGWINKENSISELKIEYEKYF